MKRAIWIFVAVSFGVSWTIAEVYYRAIGPSAAGNVVMPLAYMWGPAVGAIVAVRWGLGRPLHWLGPVFRWSRWLIIAALGPLVFAVAHTLLAALLPQIALNTTAEQLIASTLQSVPAAHREVAREQLGKFGEALPWVLLAQLVFGGVVAGLTVNAIAAFGEELGWRGFMQRALAGRGFWSASALIGVIWGLWHAPLILRGHNYPEHPDFGVLMMVVFCVLLSPLFAHLRERAGSVLAPTIMHGCLNATGGVLVFVSGGSDLLKGPAGLAGMLVLLAANAWLWRARHRAGAVALQAGGEQEA